MNNSMKLDQSLLSVFSKRWISLAVIIAAGILFAFLKLNGNSVEQTLWAEDGTIFINQAREFGISSLWITYAGYFHLYPRLVSWLSSLFGLQATPLIFLLGWFLAYVSLIYIAATRALQYGLHPVAVGLLVILMLAQPHSGEVFFNLTNAQWFMGGALAIYVLVPIKDRSSIYEKGILLLASLTGPFALILTPILLIQLVIYRDWNNRQSVYIMVGTGALVQCAAIFISNRLTDGGFDKDISHWMIAFYNFMSFGSATAVLKVASILFWVATAYAFTVNLYKKPVRHYDSIGVVAMFLFAGGLLFLVAGLLASKSNPHWLSPLGSGARYFFVPYLLIFFAVGLVVSKQPKPKFLIYVALLTLGIFSLDNMLERKNLQFKAFAEFAKIKSDVLIPISPQWEAFPSWHIRLSNNSSRQNGKSVDSILLGVEEAKILNVLGSDESGFNSINEDSQFIFDINDKCRNARYLGVEFHIDRPEGGWVQLFWSESENFSEQQSLRRYYPVGDATVQFALPRKNIKYLRFDPLEKRNQFYINTVHLYCLGD